MDEELEVVEGREIDLRLHQEEAEILSALGRKLASTTNWWGGDSDDTTRTVIKLLATGTDVYHVQFNNVIGLVRLGTRQIKVLPKIPIEHFLYLAGKSDVAVRFSDYPAVVSSGLGFIDLLTTWFLNAAEQLISTGLRKDYTVITGELGSVRGSLHILPTFQMAFIGRPMVSCSYDELTIDSSLNRVIMAACRRVSQLELVSGHNRLRARRICFRMDGVGELRPNDARVTIDRVSKSYYKALPLAKLLLSGCGVNIFSGKYHGTTFLIRTPEIIENGYRSVISEAIPHYKVVKQRQMLGTTGLSMNPDLVIGNGIAIGDIKYKHLTANWNKPDLNQAVAFASAFHSANCAVFGFLPSADSPQPRPVPVGDIQVRSFGWIASQKLTPKEASDRIKSDVSLWIDSLGELIKYCQSSGLIIETSDG